MKLMRRIATLAAVVLAPVVVASCAFAPVMPPRGILYTDQTAPLFSGRQTGELEGRASAHSILFLVAWGNSGLKNAMKDGGIKEVRHSDYRIQNYLLIYQKYTTITYGEAEVTPAGPPR